MEDRPRTIPSIRGMAPRRYKGDGVSGATRDPDRPYSPASYAAQYGIEIERAQELRDTYSFHSEIEREIYRELAADTDLRTRALMLDDGASEADEATERVAARFLRGLERGEGIREL